MKIATNRKRMGWLTALCLLAVGAAGLLSIIGTGGSGSEIPVTISRDAKGVWFLDGPEAKPLYDTFEAMGYAVATDRLWQAELYRRQARGTLAEVFGIGQLETDMDMRVLGYSTAELEAGFAALDYDTRSVINGYVAGFNRRIAEIEADNTLLPFEFGAVGFTPAEWTPADVLAWMALLQRNFDPEALELDQIENATLYGELVAEFGALVGAGMFADLRWTNDPDALTYIPAAAPDAAADQALARIPDASPPDLGEFSKNLQKFRQKVIDNLKEINAYVKMGSYAWVVAADKTQSGNPIIYSGPQMGFSVPSIVMEGSIRSSGLNVSGMTVPGVPGIIIGRTPHHAWSMQVGHAHTTDFYFEDAADVALHRTETIHVAGAADVILPVYRSAHGPIVNTLLDPTFDPATALGPIIAYKYSHWGYEFATITAFLQAARAESMDEFGAAIEGMAVSQHFCYADRDGNIAYWMSGRDPVRPVGEWRLPQGAAGAPLEWDAAVLKTRSTDRNTSQGYYCGWNNKSNPNYDNTYNDTGVLYGPFHRAHVIDDYLSTHNDLTFEQVRDLALNIATTDSFNGGGNPWQFVSARFIAAVQGAGVNADRQAALDIMAAWDGHFVDGGSAQWAAGTDRADAWMLMDAWLYEALRLTFQDELATATMTYQDQSPVVLFNVFLHGLAGATSGVVNNYDWFTNLDDPGAPQTADDIIVEALDNTLVALGARPWGAGQRGLITYDHDLIGQVWTTPYSNRSTYAHCVEYGSSGPLRIESMFPLGESGDIRPDAGGAPEFNTHFFSMTPEYDAFAPRSFPLFD